MVTIEKPTVFPPLAELEHTSAAVPAQVRHLAQFLQAHLDPQWELCVRPHLNGLVPFSQRDPAAYSDVILVAQDCRTGATTVCRLKRHNVVVMHTFHGDSRRNGNGRRAFALNHAGVKATTFHSIKGWGVRYLVVCISHAEHDSDLTALYVALSRLKVSDTGHASYITVVSAVPRLAHYGRTWPGYDNAPWLRYSLAS